MSRDMAILSILTFFVVILVSAPARGNGLLSNGGFEGGSYSDGDDTIPDGWNKQETPGETSVISLAADNGPSAAGATALQFSRIDVGHSGAATLIRQDMDISTSDGRALELRLDIKVLSHDLCGGGRVGGQEYPVTVVITYRDSAEDVQRAQVGWYLHTSGGCLATDEWTYQSSSGRWAKSKQVSADAWYAERIDLLDPQLDIARVSRIEVGGTGWSFEGCVDNVSILGQGGITIGGDDWDTWIESDPLVDPVDPCVGEVSICTTEDDLKCLFVEDTRTFSVDYNLNVTRMPQDETRFPVALRARMVRTCGGVLGIRNLTLGSYVALDVGCDHSTAEDDLLNLDGPLAGANRTETEQASTDPADPEGVEATWVETSNATLELQLGDNRLRIEGLGPGGRTNTEHPQAFELLIGQGEPNLEGTVVQPCEGIAISGDLWNESIEIDAEAGRPPPDILATSDGVMTLAFLDPGGLGNRWVDYVIYVTELPEGETKFPVLVEGRNLQADRSGLMVSNLSLNAAPCPSVWVAVEFHAGEPSIAKSRDAAGHLEEEVAVGHSIARTDDPLESSMDVPFGAIRTVNAKLELTEGVNVLRFQNAGTSDLPACDRLGSGFQLSRFWIGGDLPDPKPCGLISGEFLLLRGDANHDHVIDLSDAVYTLIWEFAGGLAPACKESLDVNHDARIDTSDPVFTLNYLFRGGPSIPAADRESCKWFKCNVKFGCTTELSSCP